MLTVIYDVFVNKIVMPAMKKPDQADVYADGAAGLTPIVERL